MGYFGTNEDLPATTSFRAGPWTGLYEAGKLRYLRLGNCEVLRMIYPAIRDQYWRTAPAQIISEKIQIEAQSFSIEYTARYKLETVDFQAQYVFQGDADGRLSVEMYGEALGDFQRNRIGLCVLHPIDSCVGKPVVITHPDQTQTLSVFPELISPHQPFLEIQSLAWSPTDGVEVQLNFEGDIFETEDQRNWTDNSFKTYSTPLRIPFPVEVQKGEQLFQKILLQCQVRKVVESGHLSENVQIKPTGEIFPFPALGTIINNGGLASRVSEQIGQLGLSFLKVQLHLDDPDFLQHLKKALASAQSLSIQIGISVFLGEETELFTLLEALKPHIQHIHHLCVLSANGPVPGVELQESTYMHCKQAFPQLPVGLGTDGFFTHLNRNRPARSQFDFLQFSLNPQVHAVDSRTLIENLVAQRDVVHTVQSFAGGKPIYVSPVTLRARNQPNPADTIDPRQHSSLVAAWTLISMKYLAPCAALTYFEAIGEKGLLSNEGASPLADYLQQIAEFQPVCIVDTHSSDPLKKDLLLLENGRKERLGFEVDFVEGEIRVK